MLHSHHSHPHHGHHLGTKRGRFRLLIRRNAFIIGLVASALVMYGGTRYLQHVLDTEGYQEGADVMRLASCTARLSHLKVLPEDTGLDRSHVSQYIVQRHAVYDHMAQDVEKKGMKLGGVITQGLTQNDLFRMTVTHPDTTQNQPRALKSKEPTTQVHIQPVLKALDIPVRAMIMPLLDSIAAQTISQAVHKMILPVVPAGGIWVQDSSLFHATIFHASSHVKPIPATEAVVTDEHQRIQKVTASTCPIHAVLERVVVTSSGVIVACWQATEQGGEPAILRQNLAQALPNAPPKEAQMVKEPSMLHTTLARLLQPPPITSLEDGTVKTEAVDTQLVVNTVKRLSDTLCGLQAVFDEIWFVEEQDLLALALQGRYIKHPARLTCPEEPVQ